jgi:prepilin-type N-terminal cleavage/methylation domain-containing protein
MPGAGTKGSRGFTFVELIVVLAILSFAFTYAIVHLDGATAAARLSSEARRVGTTIEFLRGQAIQARRPLEMHMDLDQCAWHCVVPPRPSESEADRQEQEDVISTDPAPLERGIRFDGIQLDGHETQTTGTLVVTFSPLGEISPNGFMIRLASDEIPDPDQACFSVEVNGLTGEVSYLAGNAPFDQVVKGESF